jgi:hypothetical protein
MGQQVLLLTPKDTFVNGARTGTIASGIAITIFWARHRRDTFSSPNRHPSMFYVFMHKPLYMAYCAAINHNMIDKSEKRMVPGVKLFVIDSWNDPVFATIQKRMHLISARDTF